MKQQIMLQWLGYVLVYMLTQVECICDVRCAVCSSDQICLQCNKNYVYNATLQSCQSICQNNTYMYDANAQCLSVCPSSFYNDNTLQSCVKYPDCPLLLEKGQNHFDLIQSAAVTKNLIFLTGTKNNDVTIANSLKVYTRANNEMAGQLVAHSQPIISVRTDSYNGVDELFSFSSTELIFWDIIMGQQIRKGLFDQNLIATSISYFDQDIIILQGQDQTFGVLKLDQFRKLGSAYSSTLYVNKDINTIKGFERNLDKLYTYSQDGKLYQYQLDQPSVKQQLCQLSNPIQQAFAFSQTSIVMNFGSYEVGYYNGNSCVLSTLNHANVITNVLHDIDATTQTQYIFTFDSQSFKFSFVNSNKQIQLISFRNIKKSFSKVMKSYLITIDSYGQIIMYTYANQLLKETITKNLSYLTYFAITDVYIGLNSKQMYIFGSEIQYLTMDLSNVDNFQVDLQSRIKNIPLSMVKHINKVNGVRFDSWFGRVVSFSDDGSIIFYDQIGDSYKLVMQKYYPSTDCNMLENVRCFKAVNDLQIIRQNLYAAVYSDASIIIWKYGSLSFDMIKTLTLTDRSIPILNIYFDGGSQLVYCNGKEIRVYNIDTDMIVMVYAPTDALKNNFLHCATDVYNGDTLLIATKIRDASYMVLFAASFSLLNNQLAPIIPATNIFVFMRDFYLAQYFPTIQWYMATNSQLQLAFCTFPLFKTTCFIVSQNLPVSVAFDPVTKDFTVFSRNQFVSFFKYNNVAYTKQNTYQFASVVYGNQSMVISTPKLFFYFQNTGVSTIQNQVFVLKENLNFQLVLTFEDKISSLNVDSTTKKLYIGFENGNIYSGYYIEDYNLFSQTIDYNSFSYIDQSDTLFAYKKDISIIDTTLLTQTGSLVDAAMISNLVGVTYIDSTKELIAFNNDANKNLVKWNLTTKTNQQFMNGHTTGVVDVQLDQTRNYAISQGVDLLIIIWNYVDLTQVQQISEHLNSKLALDIAEQAVPVEYKTVFKIILFVVDVSSKVIVSANNIGEIYIHNYNARTYQKQQVTAVTYVYADLTYRHVIAASANNFVYKLSIFEYTSDSLSFFKDVANLHTEQILGVLIQNDNIYSYEQTKIVVMERSTLYQKNSIVCVNPLITNFIVYEKFRQVIIWSDAQTTILNQSIGIYNLDTGIKIIDINNNQIIEQGNIHKLILDQDTNQLIISKSYVSNYIYTIDLSTFYYSGYYTSAYIGFLKIWKFIPRTNRLIYIDSQSPSNLKIYNMEASINQRNNFEVITDERNKNYFMNQVSNNIYYIDAINQSWQMSLATDKLNFKTSYDQVKLSKQIGDYFYMVTSSKALKFTLDLLQISEFDFNSYQVFFTNLYLYLTDFNNSIIQLELSSFRQLSFQRQLEGPIKQFIAVENYKEIIVMLSTKIYRFGMTNGDNIQSYSNIINLQQISVDTINPVIIHVISPTTLIFYSYLQSNPSYMANMLYIIDIGFTPYKIKFDSVQKTLIILSITSSIPIVQVFSYIFNSASVLQPVTLISRIPSPSRSAKQFINLTDASYLQIILPWQIIYYDRITYKFVKYMRDTKVIYSRISIQTVDQFPNLLNSIQKDSAQLYPLVNNIFQQPSLYKFSFQYPVILQYNLTQQSIYYQIRMIGISSSFIFDYSFQIPFPENTITPTFDSCYYHVDGVYNYNVEIQMSYLQNSIQKLNFNLAKSLIEVDAENGFFYHSLMKTYNSNTVYSNSDAQRPTIMMTQNIFTILQQNQVIIDNYILDISGGGVIQLNSNAKRVIFKSIQIVGNSKDFMFQFSNIDSIIFEDILINKLTLSGSSILFQIIQCNNVYIKNMRIYNLSLQDTSTLFYVKDIVQNLMIESLTINYLQISSQSQSQYVIVLMNIQNATINNSKFQQVTAVQASTGYYLISSQGIQVLTINSMIFNFSLGCSFLQSKNYYRDNQQIVYLHNDNLIINASTFTAHYSLVVPFISIEGNTIEIDSSNFYNIECISCDGTVLSLVSVLTSFTTKDSYFHHTIGQQGGAIAFINNLYVPLTVQDCSFYNCTATASGGALFISSSDLILNGSTITNCQAQIGGGIRYIGIEPQFIQQMNLSRRFLKTQSTNTIELNTASIYGQNIGSYPKTIKIMDSSGLQKEIYFPADDSDQYNLDLYTLKNFQSGAEINFDFQILDQEENPIFFDLTLLNENNYPSIIADEITQFNIKALPGNDNIKVFGQYITDYFQFDQITKTFSIKQMLIIGEPTSTNYILFETPSIQKIIDLTDNTRQFNAGPFHIRLNIIFRSCIRGEVYKLSGSIFYCQECKEGTYSIIQPTKEEFDSQLCLRCPDEASYCYRDQMELKAGYWKFSNNTDQIVYCSNKPENCDGTQYTQYCIVGHIGPQCETCDIYGNLWGKEYQSDGKLGCINCTELRQPQYLLPTIFIAVGMVLYILISIRIASQISQLIVQGYYLRQLNLLSINKSAYQDTTNMNMKAMVNYMQISSMINTFVVQLPEFMTFIPQYFGSPIENMLYTFDCYLSHASETKFPIIYLRTLWSFCIPIFYLVGVGIVYFVLVKLRLIKLNRAYIISGLVFLSFFTQPNMVSNLLGVMSCREIDGKLYISSDISYECYTKIHLTYIGIVCIPGLILWGALIPIYIIRLLVTNKDKLDHALIRLKYGFLYQDFKNERYYWEFIKMYKKLFAVAVLNFYGNPYTNKLVIILVVFLLYLVALLRFKPYQMQYFQKLDRNSMIVAITLLLMNIFLFNKPDEVQQQIFYVILLIIHNGYQLYLIWEVLIAKISVQFRAKYNYVKRQIIKQVPFLKKYIKITENTKMKTFHMWMKIKYYLNEYVERKQYNEINQVKLLGSRSNSVQNQNQSFLPSKRNRMRMQIQNSANNLQPSSNNNNNNNNNNNTALHNSARQGGENNYGLQDEFSQRNFLSKDQLLSAERLDNINYLSPKGSSNNLLIISSAKREESARGQYGNYLDIDDIILSPNRNFAPNSPLSSQKQDSNEINNYGEIEEQEDVNRLQKKKSLNYDYRIYQKTDLIKKNLIPAFETGITKYPKQNSLDQVQENNDDSENPDVNESLTLQHNNFENLSRNTNTLAPRFQFSKTATNELDETPKGEMMMKMPVKLELVNLNDSQDDEKQNQNEGNEEEEDGRRIHTKQLINHNLSIQKKANMIYRNLNKIECSQIVCSFVKLQDQIENILETEEDSDKQIIERQLQNQENNFIIKQKSAQSQHSDLHLQPQILSQKNLLTNSDLIDPQSFNSNSDQKQLKQNLIDQQSQISNSDPKGLTSNENIQQNQFEETSLMPIKQQTQLLPIQNQEIDINMSRQIQEIIQNNANTDNI